MSEPARDSERPFPAALAWALAIEVTSDLKRAPRMELKPTSAQLCYVYSRKRAPPLPSDDVRLGLAREATWSKHPGLRYDFPARIALICIPARSLLYVSCNPITAHMNVDMRAL